MRSLQPVAAQESRATISGTITDPSGSAIAGARITAVNVDTAAPVTAETNSLGQYRLLFLNPGNYRVTAEMRGFRTYVREGIQLNTNQAATPDVTMQLGTQAETITVGAEAPLLEAEKADRGSVVQTRNLAGMVNRHIPAVASATPATSGTCGALRYTAALKIGTSTM